MIYHIDGTEINKSYDFNGNELINIFNTNGENVYIDKQYLDGRLLIFEDDFSDNVLNEDIWGYETGNVRNGEHHFARKQNVTVENGNLAITAKHETHLNKEWTSGAVTTQGKIGWLYGRFEAKIKFPKVKGINSAFWFCGFNNYKLYRDDTDEEIAYINIPGSVPWPNCGEIDAVETMPGDTKRPYANLWDYGGESLGNKMYTQDIDISEWHIYAMEWTEDYIEISIDRNPFKRWTFSDYDAERIQQYKRPQYILITHAISDAGGTPTSYTDGAKLLCDWVRVYAPANVNNPIEETKIEIQEELTISVGEKYFLNVEFTPQNVTDMRRNWDSSNKDVASCVDGMITGISKGTSTITVESMHGLTSECIVTVTD